ncbi:ROK family protein [Carbonactinospora thermoautotrophica]|uniref:ROK family protein n=1 Tax=Carbonactinospora thermoautotrophica TaxID=1469144 RepID=A0A132MTE8_9ACTN|nr:ROK family transcriptional regulator [Carbonactinospora thermoautotrophica]KWX00990.1 ROK family protein [Carbonactinospora thermoautotrophica]
MHRKSATTSLLKSLNERTVLEAIRAGHPVSRAEISRRVGISKPTVSVALQALLDAGLVRETIPDTGPKYGALFFEPVPEAAFVLGLDLGPGVLRGALAALDGSIRAQEDVDLGEARIARAVEAAAGLKHRLLQAAGDVAPDLVDICVVGAPGVVADGRIWFAEKIQGLDGFPIVKVFSDALGTPTVVENDVHLAALAEQWRGCAQGVGHFAFLSVGSGCGAALVIDGKLHRGHRGAAGKIEYAVEGGIRSPHDPSVPGLLRLAVQRVTEATQSTSLADLLTPELVNWAAGPADAPVEAPCGPFTLEAIFTAAHAGDQIAQEVMIEAARRLARYVKPIAAVADVELVVLGGDLARGGDLLLDPLREELAKHLPYPPRLEVSTLTQAPVLTGALAAGLEKTLDNVFTKRMRRSS